MDQEELKKRREQREALRKQRQAQQRKIFIGIGVAVGILILCGILIFVLSRNSGSSDGGETAPPDTQPVTQPAETTQPVQKEEKTVIRFAAAGDLNVTDKTVAAGGVTYDYTETFVDVVDVLSRADLTVVNFEGNACGAPYGTLSTSAPQQMLEALRKAGVDMLQVANSRIISNGILGMESTLQNIRAAGLEPVGAQMEGRNYTIWEVDGVKVAVVAFTKGMDGMALPEGSGNRVNLLYTDYSSTYQKVNTSGITATLEDIAAQKPDVTIALLHWGSEYNDKISGTQETIRKLLLSKGVDAIIGTHPHYVQAIEQESNGAVVCYSLGDFISDAERAGTEYSILLELEITKNNKTGKTAITGYSYTPLYTVVEGDGTVRVVKLREAIAAYEQNALGRVSREIYESMVYALGRIEARVQPEK